MPSHPDRVRRNYHTVTVASAVHPPTESIETRIRVTKMAIASWASPRLMREDMARQVLREFERAWVVKANA